MVLFARRVKADCPSAKTLAQLTLDKRRSLVGRKTKPSLHKGSVFAFGRRTLHSLIRKVLLR